MSTQASEKQIAFINKLMGEKDVPEVLSVAIGSLVLITPDLVTKASASSMIDKLMALPSKTQAKAKVNVEAGIYTLDGSIYKVQVSPTTGRAYAKVFNEGGWVYATGAINKMHKATPLTLEEAKAYGKLYGVCIVCSRTLTDEGSIEAGIGPICAGKF